MMAIRAASRGGPTGSGGRRRPAWVGLVSLGLGSGLGCIGPAITGISDSHEGSDGPTGDGTTDEPPVVPTTTATGEPPNPTEPVPPNPCGNGSLDPGEECDGSDLQGLTCEALGHVPGTLACSATCTLDDAGCIPPGMVYVPGGAFEMGSDATPSEEPIRSVTVDAFYIDQTEVTVAAYAACIAAGACGLPSVGNGSNHGVAGREQHPINGVTWYDAAAYCGWVDGGVKRLPTEAEWEKAARGTDGRRFPWGDEPVASCTHVVMEENLADGCGAGSTMPVGSRPLGASPYGAYDMSGNVYEWVSDFWGYYGPSDTSNPTGPAGGDYKVARGGAWSLYDPVYLTTTYRGGDLPHQQYPIIGFRCARSGA
jgi:formylglycine-generating enzyme required for sulfatase activity